jgi:hypothetical protein
MLSRSFCLYRFRKYGSYDFPIIIFCNPGIHYETPCISTWLICWCEMQFLVNWAESRMLVTRTYIECYVF